MEKPSGDVKSISLPTAHDGDVHCVLNVKHLDSGIALSRKCLQSNGLSLQDCSTLAHVDRNRSNSFTPLSCYLVMQWLIVIL